MKKLLTILLALLMLLSLGACTSNSSNGSNQGSENQEGGDELIDLGELKLQFVPSRPAEEIITTTDGLGDLLIEQLAKRGYKVDSVDISVSSSFEAAGEALSAGSVDLAWLPSGTYCTYSDEVDVILTATPVFRI